MKTERRIQITTVSGDVLMEFFEADGRTWKQEYHLWTSAFMTPRTIALISAWLEHDDANFNHPLLTISGV